MEAVYVLRYLRYVTGKMEDRQVERQTDRMAKTDEEEQRKQMKKLVYRLKHINR